MMLYANYMRNKMKHLEQIVKVPATGTQAPPLTLENSKGKPLKDYKIFGKGVQNGTPSPDNPIEPKFVGDKTKNLLNIKNRTTNNTILDPTAGTVYPFDKDYIFQGFAFSAYSGRDCTFTQNNNDFTIVNNAGVGYGIGFNVSIKKNTNYTFSFTIKSMTTTSVRFGVHGFKNDNTTAQDYYIYNMAYSTGRVSKTFTITDTESVTYGTNAILFISLMSANGDSVEITDLQLEEGSTATTYDQFGYKVIAKMYNTPSPLVQPTETPIYLDEPIRGIDSVVDSVGLKSGRTNNIIEFKLGQTNHNWVRRDSTSIFYMMFNQIGDAVYWAKDEVGATCLSNYYAGSSGWYSGIANNVVTTNVTEHKGIAIRDDRFNNAADFKTYIDGLYAAGTPIKVYYPLANPTTTPITNLPQIPTTKGNCILEIVSETQPTSMEVKYVK